MLGTTLARRSLLAAGGLVTAVALAGCAGSSGASDGASAAAPHSSSAAAGGRSGGGAAAGRGPAASGKIAAITGTTMQVQSRQSGQVAVAWTSGTRFTHLVAMKVSAIAVGACVTAVGGSGTAAGATSFTATSLIVSSAQDGACTGRGRSGNPSSGARPSGLPSGVVPSGFPGGARSSGFAGGGSARAQIGAIASGKVTAVSGSTLTVATQQFGSSSTTPKKVTVDATTKVTTQAVTTAKSLAVGQCVTAEGKADTSGTVTATRVQITTPTDGECTVGYGGFGRGGAGG